MTQESSFAAAVETAVSASPALLWGGNGAMWTQTGLMLVAAAAAVFVIWHNGKKSRERALIDLLIHQKSDPSMIEAQATVQKLRDTPNCNLGVHLSNPDHAVEKQHVLLVLNNYEFIAVGVRLGAFDETLYKQLQWSSVVSVWRVAKPYVAQLRVDSQKPTIFQDFPHLAERWTDDPIKKL